MSVCAGEAQGLEVRLVETVARSKTVSYTEMNII
jgi:hypothetical protein